jgi:RNA-binding protein 39
MRTTDRDIQKFFKAQGLKVNQVILLRDRRTGRHKGCAYVELRQMEQVAKALALSGKAPDFQRFPILIKPSEAEKNYIPSAKQLNAMTTIPTIATTQSPGVYVPPTVQPPPHVLGPNGKFVESQRVYVGSLDPSITPEHLFALFSPFGQLQKVALQMDSGISKGFAFLTFTDPKSSCLAIQTMSGQVLASRTIKTGWANHMPPTTNIEIVKSDEFPPDASTRAHQAYQALAQLNMGVMPVMTPVAAYVPSVTPAAATNGMPRVGTVAEARASLAAASAGVFPAAPLSLMVAAPIAPPLQPTNLIGNAEHPTPNLLVHNMYDKDTETEPGWENDLREEFQEECTKFGTILGIKVLSQEPGGKIVCKFDALAGAQSCASNLAGRWFDKRLLRVEFLSDETVTSLLL